MLVVLLAAPTCTFPIGSPAALDQRLLKALGIALAGHVLLLGAVQQVLPEQHAAAPSPSSRESLLTIEPEAPTKAPPPIDIEFVDAPAPQVAPPTPQAIASSSAPPTTAPRDRSRPKSQAPRKDMSASRPPIGTEPLTGPSETAREPGALSMRGRQPSGTAQTQRGPSIPNLDPRVALRGAMPGPGATGTKRPALLAGAHSGRSESSWVPAGGGTMRATGEPFHAKIHRDGTIEFRDKPNVQLEGVKISKTFGIPVLFGRFDVTDAVMAQLGETLYPYRKLRLMDQSREARAEMAKESQRENLQSALALYKKHLRRVWLHPELSLAERRRALFLLWDECAEAGPEDVLTSANSIRAMTISFIRRELPQGSSKAYSAQELAAFNQARRSSKRFAPYR